MAKAKFVDDMGLTTRTMNCLKWCEVYYISEVAKLSYKELIKMPGIGHKSANEILEALQKLKGCANG